MKDDTQEVAELDPDHPLGDVPADDPPEGLVSEDVEYEDPEYDTWHDKIDPESRGFAWSGPEGPDAKE